MPTLTLNSAYNFAATADAAWVLSSKSATSLTYTSALQTQTLAGTFSFSANGAASGVVTSLVYRMPSGAQVYRIDGLTADAAQMQTFMSTVGDLQQSYAYLLKGNDAISGVPGSALRGYDGDDTFTAPGAGSTIDGGAGNDTVVFRSAQSAFAFYYIAASGTLISYSNSEGEQRISNVENFVFADQSTLTLAQMIAKARGALSVLDPVNGGATHMQVGATLSGRLGTVGEQDAFTVDLVAGNVYAFRADADASAGLLDPFLTLRDASGTPLASDDDSGAGRNAAFTFTPATTGSYVLTASSGAYGAAHSTSGGGTGNYVVGVTSTTLGAPGNAIAHAAPSSLVSASAAGVPGNATSLWNHGIQATLSADGRYVVFSSDATNLGAPATGVGDNIYVKDMQTGAIRTVLVPLLPPTILRAVTISGDGHFVAFNGFEGEFVAGGDQKTMGTFVANVDTGVITRAGSNTYGHDAQLSFDGHYLLFLTGTATIVRADLQSGTSTTVASGTQAQMSLDGRYVTFVNGDVYRKDMLTGALALVTVPDPALAIKPALDDLQVSQDGRYVLYASDVAPANWPKADAYVEPYVKDMLTGAVQRIGLAPNGERAHAWDVRMSADGRFVVFNSYNDFVPGHVADSGADYVFVHDMVSGAVLPLALVGQPVTGGLYVQDISADGSTILVSAGLASNRSASQFFEVSNPFLDVATPASYTMDARELTLTLTGGAPVAGVGNAKANHLVGNGANNVLSGGAGDDLIDGGGGVDTALFSGPRAHYTITALAQGRAVIDASGADGHDTLLNIARLQFADSAIAFDVDGTAGKAYRLYQAAFDRAPDAAGLGYWLHALDVGTPLRDVAGSFMGSAEFIAAYGAAPSDLAFVELLYANVLHRAPDAAGVDYWVGGLHGGTARTDMLAYFSESAENQAQLIGTIVLGMGYVPFS